MKKKEERSAIIYMRGIERPMVKEQRISKVSGNIVPSVDANIDGDRRGGDDDDSGKNT